MSEIKVNSIKGVGASTAAITVNNTNGTCTANITNNLSNRNKVINGAALISQRGTISDHGTSVKYTAVDRFCTKIGTSFNFDVTSSQSTDVPAGFQNSLKLSPDSTQTPSGSANGGVQTKLEGQDLQDFAFGSSSAKAMTLSFYAKSGSAGAGTYSIEMQWVSSSGSLYHQTRAFTITSSWQRFTFSFEANGDSTSVAMKNDNTDTLRIIWHLASGDDDKTSAITTWTNTGAMKTITGMNNFMSSTSNEFYLTGVQLEVDNTGSGVATDFEHRSFGDELRRCQRYFYKTYRQGIAPGTDDVTDIISKRNEMSSAKTDMVLNIAYSVPMRATPTIVGYSKAGNSNKLLVTGIDYSGGSEGTFAGTVYRGRKYLNQLSSGVSVASGSYAHFHFTASAEL
jgi:hypothetical protein